MKMIFGDILLINAPREITAVKNNPKDLRMPLGLMYISSYLKSKGVHSKVLDAEALSMGLSDIVDIAAETKPSIIGFNCHTLNRHVVYEIVKTLKIVLKDTSIILGGSHPTLAPKDTLAECPEIDAIVIGEGERTVYEISKGAEEIEKIPGIAFVKDGKYYQNKPVNRIKNLDALPFPDIEDVPIEKYILYEDSVLPGLWNRAYLNASRGCKYKCSFCVENPLWEGKTTFRSVESILKEIEEYHKRFNIKHFYFYDDTLTDWPYIEDFCNTCSKLEIFWSCSTRVDHMNDSVIKMLSKGRCKEIAFGLESGSNKILNKIKKRWENLYSHERIGMLIKSCVNQGIIPRIHFMIGFPWEDQNDIVNTVKLAVSLKKYSLSDVNFFVVKLFPGTHLYNLMSQNTNEINDKIYNSWSVFDWFNIKNKKVAAKLMRFNDIPVISSHPILDSLQLRRVVRNAWEIFFSDCSEDEVEQYLWNGIVWQC